MEPEKRERIINAALKEFARNGYERASTNEIIKEAEISKGSLFSYFNNKKGLYLFLFEYVNGIIEKIYEETDWSDTDIFNRMKSIGLAKFKIYKRFPQAFDFLKSVTLEDAPELKSEIKKFSSNLIERGFEKGYENIDLTKFRDDIDIQKTIDIINWTILSFAEQQMNRVSSIENVGIEILSECDDYFDIMKRCFYKKEEQ